MLVHSARRLVHAALLRPAALASSGPTAHSTQLLKIDGPKKEYEPPAISRSQHNLASRMKRRQKPTKAKNPEDYLHPDTLELPNVRVHIFDKTRDEPRLLGGEPIPYSPQLRDYKIEKPQVYPKTYFWCSCGLSAKQPFCDNSHSGSLFKPIKFALDQQVDAIHLCGCKYTSNAPYCDGQTCLALREGATAPTLRPETIELETERRTLQLSVRERLAAGRKSLTPASQQRIAMFSEEQQQQQEEAQEIEVVSEEQEQEREGGGGGRGRAK